MRLLAFHHNGQPALGLRLDQEVVNLTAEGLPATLDELLRAGPDAMAAAKKAGSSARTRLPLSDIDWLPPVQSPSKAIAVGLNYIDHAAESKFDPPTYPVLFHRFLRRGSATTSRSCARTCRRSSTTRASCWWSSARPAGTSRRPMR